MLVAFTLIGLSIVPLVILRDKIKGVHVKFEGSDYLGAIAITILLTSIGFFVGFVLSLGVSHLADWSEYSDNKIVSLQDGSGAEGSFFLGTGYVDDRMTYSYYIESNGGYFLEQADAEGIKILYGLPGVVYESRCYPEWIMWPFPNCDYEGAIAIQVPEGTVKQNFVLDAQ